MRRKATKVWQNSLRQKSNCINELYKIINKYQIINKYFYLAE